MGSQTRATQPTSGGDDLGVESKGEIRVKERGWALRGSTGKGRGCKGQDIGSSSGILE